MVKRSRAQSHEAPRRLQLADDGAAGFGLPLPDALQEFLAARARAGRCSCRSTSWRSTTICVAMPAWSVPGCQSASLPAHALVADQDVLQRVVERVAHVQEPVTFGGGITIA